MGPRKRLVLLLSHEETKEFGSRSDNTSFFEELGVYLANSMERCRRETRGSRLGGTDLAHDERTDPNIIVND